MLLGRLWHTQCMLQVARACGLFVAWGRVEYSVLGGQPTHGLANSTGGLLMPHHTGCASLWAASGVLCVCQGGWHSVCWVFSLRGLLTEQEPPSTTKDCTLALVQSLLCCARLAAAFASLLLT